MDRFYFFQGFETSDVQKILQNKRDWPVLLTSPFIETVAIELVSSQHILTEPDVPESEDDVADATNQIHCLKCAALETANDRNDEAY